MTAVLVQKCATLHAADHRLIVNEPLRSRLEGIMRTSHYHYFGRLSVQLHTQTTKVLVVVVFDRKVVSLGSGKDRNFRIPLSCLFSFLPVQTVQVHSAVSKPIFCLSFFLSSATSASDTSERRRTLGLRDPRPGNAL